eukprot:s1768_g9.t1
MIVEDTTNLLGMFNHNPLRESLSANQHEGTPEGFEHQEAEAPRLARFGGPPSATSEEVPSFKNVSSDEIRSVAVLHKVPWLLTSVDYRNDGC